MGSALGAFTYSEAEEPVLDIEPGLLVPLCATASKVYVAGCCHERHKMRRRMDEMEALGYTITHDWTAAGGENSAPDLPACARADLQGVIDADVVLACMDKPIYTYRGTWTEVGAALALGKRVLVYMPDPDENINQTNVFYHHHGVTRARTWTEVKEIMGTRLLARGLASG